MYHSAQDARGRLIETRNLYNLPLMLPRPWTTGRLLTHPARALLVVFALVPGCRRTAPPRDARPDLAHARDATLEAPALPDATRPAADEGAAFGPPNPWGDGALPDSTATGPEAERTRAAMVALRASIGFWRIERDARAYCPTLRDLARTPGAAFDPATMERDAWGTPFEIECQGAAVRLRSLGPDRTRDTPDDLLTH